MIVETQTIRDYKGGRSSMKEMLRIDSSEVICKRSEIAVKLVLNGNWVLASRDDYQIA